MAYHLRRLCLSRYFKSCLHLSSFFCTMEYFIPPYYLWLGHNLLLYQISRDTRMCYLHADLVHETLIITRPKLIIIYIYVTASLCNISPGTLWSLLRIKWFYEIYFHLVSFSLHWKVKFFQSSSKPSDEDSMS